MINELAALYFSSAALHLNLQALFAPVLIVSDSMSGYDDVWVRSTVPLTFKIKWRTVLENRISSTHFDVLN